MTQKKKNLEKKLMKYSALAAGVVVAGNASAQIHYTDIDPDETVNSVDSFMLDLNNDGTVDFKIHATAIENSMSYTYYGSVVFAYKLDIDAVMVDALNSNEVLNKYVYNSYSSYNSGLRAFDQNDSIMSVSNSSSYWTDTSYGILNGQGSFYINYLGYTSSGVFDYGFFKGVTDKYIGLRLKAEDNGNVVWHYGWARLDVAADATSFTIKDYAYEGTADKPILAGMTTSDVITDGMDVETNIYVDNKKLFVDLNDLNIDDAVMRLVSVNGKELMRKNIENSITEIDLSVYAPGTYIVNVYHRSGLISEKVINK